MTLRFGVILPGGSAREQLDQAVLAEQAGWDGVFVSEAAYGVDAWSLLAAMAARTTRVRLGTMLTPLPWRRPWKLASQVATLDQLSGGRATLAIGVGAVTDDLPVTGEQTDLRLRASMMDEGIDLIRAFSEDVYGVARERVIGSSVKTRFDIQSGHGELVKLAELNSFDDREEKVVNIGLHIGRRPILAFGNSDGDLAMLRYTKTGRGPSLALLLHHDDVAREYVYDRQFHLSPLSEGLDKAIEYGLTLVSMKRDWRTVFGASVSLTIPGTVPARA